MDLTVGREDGPGAAVARHAGKRLRQRMEQARAVLALVRRGRRIDDAQLQIGHALGVLHDRGDGRVRLFGAAVDLHGAGPVDQQHGNVLLRLPLLDAQVRPGQDGDEHGESERAAPGPRGAPPDGEGEQQ